MTKVGQPNMTKQWKLLTPVLFLLILVIGIYFRFAGLFWGEYQYLHPDERFLVWVTADISSVKDLNDYFDTANSSLNPHNRGHGFFVYGNFPVVLVRYLMEGIFENPGWKEALQTGRTVSTFFDLGSVILIFFIGKKLFNKKIGLLAMAFLAMTVANIQQAHFYTVDTIAAFFVTLAIYIALHIAMYEYPPEISEVFGNTDEIQKDNVSINHVKIKRRFSFPNTTILSILFGIIVGFSAASKINTGVIAFLLPLAFIILWFSHRHREGKIYFDMILRDLILGGVAAVIFFRILQPYAFSGPGFFEITPNPLWLANIKEVGIQSSGDVDFPPALQWARRDFGFAFRNLTQWGMGFPMAIAAWFGLALLGWRILKGKNSPTLLVWVWTVFFFLWQSSLGNPMMRYQMPVLPMLALMAAWFLVELWGLHPKVKTQRKFMRVTGAILSGVAIIGTAIWAFMFSRIYVEPISRIDASRWIFQNVPGPINLMIEYDEEGLTREVFPFPYNNSIIEGNPYSTTFSVENDGILKGISFAKIQQQAVGIESTTILNVVVKDLIANGEELAQESIDSDFYHDAFNSSYTVNFDNVVLQKEHVYQLVLEYEGPGSLTLNGSAVVLETSWDDPLPYRMDGKDAYGGIYQDGLNFEMYWDDNEGKLNRFLSLLDQGDYIFMSSNRQWGTTTRVPERYPLTTQFYRSLIGCPDDKDVYWCYSIAQSDTFKGDLGYELIKVFVSFPHFGDFQINDQFAEEAFTVYDHPKVMIFKKTDQYDSEKVKAILGSIDLTKVIKLTPIKFKNFPATLELPSEQMTVQKSGGTWSDIFDTEAFYNQKPLFAAILWYLVVTLLGWVVYPMLRFALGGLADKGYAMSKMAGMLLLAFLVWWAGSMEIAITRDTISLILGILFLSGILFAILQRKDIETDLKEKISYYFLVEGITLLLFIVFLLVRIGNPDLWHPGKGGEKPMDFSYFNAILKSTTFPPYDPWYAGGYINYYYYGFVVVGVLVKWLGVVPSIAYNLILPTLFALVGIGSFGVSWNIVSIFQKSDINREIKRPLYRSGAVWAGIAAIALVLILGNLGTVRMIWHGLQKMGSPNGIIDNASFFQRWEWTFEGLIDYVGGEKPPFYPGDWYWVPSRALPQEPITEFPFFTFLYGDLHAHMISLPITLLALGWVVSLLGQRWKFKDGFLAWLNKLWILVFGAIVVGSLRPTNTWDLPAYLLLGVFVLMYIILRYAKGIAIRHDTAQWFDRIVEAVIAIAVFVVLSFVLYKPFSDWYGQAYNSIEIWKGTHSPFWSYFTHWGLFLFLLFSWFVTETIQWMAETPLRELSKLKKYVPVIYGALALLVTAVALLLIKEIEISWVVLPMAAWAGVLIIRKDQSDAKRLVLFMTGTAFVLTLMVELIVLRGDIGRMNTVFKFYLQAWVLFGISAACGVVWMVSEARKRWSFAQKNLWQMICILLAGSAALYPVLAGTEKIQDRMSTPAPQTLDGMAYMQSAYYFDENVRMSLNADYKAIRWMQETVQGSPVIVEANTVEYRWGNRFTIYTGLPGVVGWNWHQRQQRGVIPSEWIFRRVEEIREFYTTPNAILAQEFLEKYQVKYIVLGIYERALYPGDGLKKFELYNQDIWKTVYQDGETVIYEVIN
jgi:YYY domain-containing protein